MILPCGVLIMNSKVLKVFYGVDNLPYKDKERVTHFPVVGGTFMGASNTTEIWFYFERIGEPNNTWVAIAKLPNGKRGAVKLDTFTDTELNEPYAKLQLNTWFTQMRGDVYISLNGYDGGITLSLDQETGLYSVTGTPVIQATGSVKLTIQYATQLIGGDEIDEITLQEIYAMFGEKLDTNKGIVVIANPQVDITQYDVGQYFYSKSDNSIYEKVVNEAEPIPVLTLRFTAYSKSESDTLLATKVEKTTDTNIVYGTNNSGEQYKVPYSSDFSGKGNNLVQRDSNAQVNVPTTPTSNNHATSKGYVDTQIDTRVAKTNVGDKVYGTDESGNQKTFDVDNDLVSGENGIVVRRLYPNGQVIVGNPSATNHATPKKYVDDNFAHTLDLTIDSNYDLVVKLLNANGVVISQDDVDLPLESIVVSATYYETYTYEGVTYNKVIVIVLSTTSVPTIIPVGDLVSGLVSTDELATALSSYYTKTQADNKFVEQVSGKGLSSNDFTDAYKNKLDGIESGAEVNVIDEITVDNVALTPTDKSVNIDLSGKQDLLVSGTNIKSINNTSLLGSGNIDYDSALSDSSTNAVQNKILKGYLDDIGNRLAVLEESIIADDSLNYTYLSDSSIPTNANTYPIIESAGMDNTNIKGNSFVYNQLVDTNTTEVATITGHKYLTRISGTNSLVTATSGQTFSVTGGVDCVYDLTQSNLDSVSTVDEAIAELLKRGINVYEYNPYSTGEIRNSKPTALISKDTNDNVLGTYPLSLPVLRSAGSVQDDTKKVNVGVVNLGSLSWTYVTSGTYPRFVALLSQAKHPTNINSLPNIICSKYVTATHNDLSNNGVDKAVTLQVGGDYLWVADSAYTDAATFKSAMSSVTLNYELATPTDQPAITLPENIEFEKGGSLEVTYDSTAPTPADFDFEVAVYKPIQ